MSSEKKCCVPGCFGNQDSHTVLHLFPNPAKDMDRFKSWLFNIGGDILAFSNEYIYKNRRVCHAHFETKYFCRYNRISNIAVPTLNLSGPSKLMHSTTSIKKRPLTSIENIINMPSTSKDSQLLGSEQEISTPSIEIEKTIDSNLLERKISSEVSKESPFNQKKIQAMRKVSVLRSKLTKTEQNLYKTLLHVKAKLSNYKNMFKKQATALKNAKKIFTNIKFIKARENITSTGRLITLMQFRESSKKDKG
ncbi:hypothetical protein evm_013776 [Chilo suppressalis]|nr:hypothetical protein evm_013776 [Chilo suppressalis]